VRRKGKMRVTPEELDMARQITGRLDYDVAGAIREARLDGYRMGLAVAEREFYCGMEAFAALMSREREAVDREAQ
jgi:hypothetical protein